MCRVFQTEIETILLAGGFSVYLSDLEVISHVDYVQESENRRALGCVNPASWFSLAAEGEFTQPRAHLLADPCKS